MALEMGKNLTDHDIRKWYKKKSMAWKDDCKIEKCYVQTGTTERPGGQHAGMPATFVRVTHLPTGTVAEVCDTKSQFEQKRIAMLMIELALVEMKLI